MTEIQKPVASEDDGLLTEEQIRDIGKKDFRYDMSFIADYGAEVETATYDAEENLLGAIMIQSCTGDRTAIEKVSKILEPIDFDGCFLKDAISNWPVHARIYYAMLQCDNAPHQVNVALQMNKLDILKINDCVHLAHYITYVPCSLDYLDYAHVIKEYSTLRQVRYYANKGDLAKLNKITKPKFEDGIKL